VLIFGEKVFMLRPKVKEILNEKFRDHISAHFVIFGTITIIVINSYN
jgi:hypothetical protein